MLFCIDKPDFRNADDGNPFETYPSNLNDDNKLTDNDGLPEVTAAQSTSSQTNNNNHPVPAQYKINKVRTCEKRTDLYILQPERLNTSGQSNPLKGKLTNCHVTGCER